MGKFCKFYDNLLFGVGPGQANQLRKDYGYGKFVTAHSEFTRLLSEHGVLGLLSVLCIIIMTLKDFRKRNREEKCIQLGLALLALLTMSHSAMRLAMPGFIFGLAFIRTTKLNWLYLTWNDKNIQEKNYFYWHIY